MIVSELFSFVFICVNGVCYGESVVIIGNFAVGAFKVFVLNLSMIYLDCWALSLNVSAKWCRFPEGVPWVRYRGVYKDLNINLIWPGKDSILGRYLTRVCVCVCLF